MVTTDGRQVDTAFEFGVNERHCPNGGMQQQQGRHRNVNERHWSNGGMQQQGRHRNVNERRGQFDCVVVKVEMGQRKDALNLTTFQGRLGFDH